MPAASSNPLAMVRCVFAVWLIVCGGIACAAELTASAHLSQNSTGVGEPVQLQITVNGARSVGHPPDVAVDGLRINCLGPSQNTSMRFENGNFVSETSVSYLYQVEPARTGNFTIPAVTVTSGGKTVQTQPVVLKVEKNGGNANNAAGDSALGFLDVVLPKKTAFVGEIVPMEIRLSGDSRVRWQPEAMPEISGEGFTKQKLPEPRQERGSKDGRDLDVFVFRTAITPGRAGRITIGPVEVAYVARVPRVQRNRPRSLFDMLDDSVFGDPFFAVNQHLKARAEALELEVKPLPVAGRPENFSGAVGRFKFTAEGNPKRVKIGDPVTMKLTVSGRGNFDRMEAPGLFNPDGWRGYPASTEFKADDDLGMSGTKTFSTAVIPEVRKSAMPAFAFAYFDPDAEKYVTLKSEPAALTVEGGVPPPPPPPLVAAALEPKEATPPAAQPAPANDIHGIRYDAGGGRRSFEPLYQHRGFLVAQCVPLLALASVLFVRLRRTDANAQRNGAWKREKSALLASLRTDPMPDQEFFDSAARVIQLETALATGRTPGSVDAAFAQSAQRLDAETAEDIERIFASRAELLYAGSGGEGGSLSPDARRQLLATLESFEKSHAHS